VDHAHFIRQTALFQSFPEQLIDRSQKCSEGFTGSGWRGDQRVFAVADRTPPIELCRGWRQHTAAVWCRLKEVGFPPAPENRLEVEGKHSTGRIYTEDGGSARPE